MNDIKPILDAFLAAIRENTTQIKELADRVKSLEIRCDHDFTSFSDWKRIEQVTAQAVAQSSRALHLVEHLTEAAGISCENV